MATHDINLFFYIKGSKDFPSGHGISEPFGFDQATATKINDTETGYINVNSETAVFSASIRDIYLKNKNAREIENTYSLISDNDNLIFNYIKNTPSLGSTPRNERSLEYLSSMIVKQSTANTEDERTAENKLYKQIYPNYTYTSKASLDALLTISSGSSSNDYPPRQAIFWQKMFSLLEFLKKEEKNIIDNDSTNSYPNTYNENKNNWFPSTVSIEAAMNNETSLGQFIGLFVGNDDFKVTSSSYEIRSSENGGSILYPTNPLRNLHLTGAMSPSTDVDDNGVPTISVIQEKLWSDLDIKYVPGTAYFERSSHNDRIKYMTFTIRYKQYSDTTVSDYETWRFTIYFDADAFIADSTTNKFGVWTYNDQDLDDEYPDASMAGFNKYDNDYANLLRDPPKYGHFMATEAEVEQAMAQAMLDQMRGNDYTAFLPVDIIRVSPELIESGTTSDNKPIYTVNWPSINSSENPTAHGVGKQTFYVLYNTVAPTASQAREAIKDYLLNLHSECGEQVYYASNEAKSGVKYIGHSNNTTDLTNWLSKMYPELFSETVVHIIPPFYTHCIDGSTDANRWDPSKYFHTETQKRLIETMKGVNTFAGFKFEENGNISIPSTSGEQRKYFGTEILYIGGLNDDQTDGAFKFPAPFIATMNADTLDNPLTSQTGFAGYTPKFFDHNASPTSPSDLLQFIIIKLMNQMFITGNQKTKLNPIAGVNVTYSQDALTDPRVSTDQTCNVATFIINNVTFNVHAQINKNFCNVNGQEVSA